MAGYCVMKWTIDANRLSSHHMKHIIEPKKSFDSYQVGDVGEAAYPGYPGRWAFVILAIGETKAQMEQWLSEFLKENGPIPKKTKNLKQSFTAKRNRPLSIVGDTHRDESPPLETHRDMAGPLVNYKNRSSLVPHRDKSPPPVMDSTHYVRHMEKPHTKRLTERDESPHHVTLEDFGIIGNTTPTKRSTPAKRSASTSAKRYTSTPAKQSWSASTPAKRSSVTPAERSSGTPAKRSALTPAKRWW